MVLIYMIFSWLDSILYSFVGQLLRLIDDLSKYNFFSLESIKDFQLKVYVVLGVFMLFKLVISAIQYLVNPDTFDDKNKGLFNVLKKMVFAVVLIVLIPTIFAAALNIQSSIVETIPKAIFGTSVDSDAMQKNGDDIAITTWSGFISLKEGHTPKKQFKEVSDIYDVALDGCSTSLLSGSFWTGNNCHYRYMWLISTAVGVFLVYILISMAIDVGIRTIKLGIIQILAPIPIAGYITDDKKLSNFVKTSLTVYTDLFVRIGIIYFCMYFLTIILSDFFTTSGYPETMKNQLSGELTDGRVFLIKIFIIVALLLFAKTAPKFITELLGLPDSGNITDMFKRAGGLFGTTLGGLRTARSNYTTQKERFAGKGYGRGRQVAEGLKSAVAGLGSATGRGLMMTGQGKGFNDVRKNAFKNTIAARNRRIDRVDNLYSSEPGNEYGYSDYRRDVRREKLGIPSDVAFIKTRYDVMEKTAKMAADAKGHGVGKMNETPNRYQISFRDAKGNFKDDDFRTINGALGFESLSMEQVRNMYAMAKNGQQIENAHGVKVSLNSSQIDALGSLVQVIEKRTSYLKEAELMGIGDPAARPNIQKIIMSIRNNESMFTDKEIMKPIYAKMSKDLKGHDAELRKYGIDVDSEGNIIDFTFDKFMQLVNTLNTDFAEKKPERKDYATDADFNAALAKYNKDYNDSIIFRADILTGIKDSFEEVTKQQFREAQIADARAQKAQQAINNNNDKK